MAVDEVRWEVGRSVISVGRFSYGEQKIRIRQAGEGAFLAIGSFCSIATDVTIFLGGEHHTEWITTFPFGHIYTDKLGGIDITGHPRTNGSVCIGHDVWVGSGATIMSGVNIGSGSVIAANAHVVRDVDPYSIVGGNPARLIRSRFSEGVVRLLLILSWWDLDLESIRAITADLCRTPNETHLKKLLDIYRPGWN
jgi:acetyltransferase-like isoleucine patch superfamily enzyme